MGHRTRWVNRLSFLDREYGSGASRSGASSHREWCIIVDTSVKALSEKKWRSEVARHHSLSIYAAKLTPSVEPFYANGMASDLLFLARSGALPTAARLSEIFTEDPTCPRCGAAWEDVAHIVMECPAFDHFRVNVPPTMSPTLRMKLGFETAPRKDAVASTKLLLKEWNTMRLTSQANA